IASQRIREIAGAGDTVARLGGDEFTVILSDPETRSRPAEIAARLVAALSAPFPILGREAIVTVSVGVAISQGHHLRADDLLRAADIAMYQAKERGRNGFVVFDESMRRMIAHRVELESDLQQAVTNGEFVLFYQPEIDLRSGRISGVEALIRWNHPLHGLINPAEFIPLAEETGLIIPLGRWVIEEATRQAREWMAQFPSSPLVMNVNLSARQLQDRDLASDICDTLRKHELPGHMLRLEITETTLMENRESNIAALSSLRARGVQIAIDDFGSGYSSLGYLKHFPVDVLKLDRSFIHDSQRPKQDDAIIHAVTTLAHGLDITITIEGIETRDQLARVKSMGCDRGQGYFFSRPLTPAQMPELLELEAPGVRPLPR
ncbi:MAG TPA: bifunctional diguanylate cyclase/phosphodiesterase, partial [Thermomicrobiales bacterium]|nr:bifunctional diguanylate cyclase/phosphodiesterase [Thermomicrobiales bacterium]